MKPRYLNHLKSLVNQFNPQSAHYVGYAHDEVLDYLLSVIPEGRLSAMDFEDRQMGNYNFDPETEERLWNAEHAAYQSIYFYEEGAPTAELVIMDMPSYYKRHGFPFLSGPRAARYVLFAYQNENDLLEPMPQFSWKTWDSCRIGVRKTV